MKVKELIETLSKLDQEKPIKAMSSDFSTYEIGGIENCKDLYIIENTSVL